MPLTRPTSSSATRIVSVYSARLLLRHDVSAPLSSAIDFGFLQRFMVDAEELLPRVVLSTEAPIEGFSGAGLVAVERLSCLTLSTPRQDTLLILIAEVPSTISAPELDAYLTHMHVERDTIEIAGRPLGEWLGEQLPIATPFRIGYSHHLVFAEAELAAAMQSDPDAFFPLVETVMGTVDDSRGGMASPRMPPTINGGSRALLVHSRSATLTAGWSAHVQNGMILVVMSVVTALAVLRRARLRAFAALQEEVRARGEALDEARQVQSRLAMALGEVQLDLSFGVEVYVDSLLIPDSRMDAYRHSMHDVVEMGTAVANTSRMVERLDAVFQARSSLLAAAEQSLQERRDRLVSGLVALGSVIAIPPALLLAFFGASTSDVTDDRSILDFSTYWLAYVVAWTPFIALFGFGFLRHRRIKPSRQPLPELPDPQP